MVTRLGKVVVRRIGYRSGIKGVRSLFPRDAVLNLPPCGYSWGLQRLAEMFTRSGSYEQAHEFVLGRDRGQHRQAAAGADHRGGGRRCGAVLPGPGPAARSRRPGPGSRAGPAAAGDLRRRQGRGDAPRGAPPPGQGPGPAGADLRQAGRDRGEERLQADGRDRLRLRRPVPDGPREPAHPGAGHAPGPRHRQERRRGR